MDFLGSLQESPAALATQGNSRSASTSRSRSPSPLSNGGFGSFSAGEPEPAPFGRFGGSFDAGELGSGAEAFPAVRSQDEPRLGVDGGFDGFGTAGNFGGG